MTTIKLFFRINSHATSFKTMELLQKLESLLCCKKHLRIKKYVCNGNYYCADCTDFKYVHPLLEQICNVFPMDPFLFQLHLASRNVEKNNDIYDFASEPLRNLDELLRCPVSKQLFDTVTLTNCLHSFDNNAKECIQETGKCPVCFMQLNEMRLEKDFLIETLSNYWAEHRDEILAFEQQQFDLSPLKIPPFKTMNNININGINKLINLNRNKEKMHLISKNCKDHDVRNKLNEFGIQQNGTKEERIQRMNKFIKKFNTNLDSNRPISCRMLLRSFIREQDIILHRKGFREDENISAEMESQIKEHCSLLYTQLRELKAKHQFK